MNSARLRVVQPRGSQQPARRSTRTVYFTSSEADDHLRRTAALQAVIERVPTALSERPYFTILSKKFTAQYPAFAKEFWRATGKVRASPEFQKKLTALGLLAE